MSINVLVVDDDPDILSTLLDNLYVHGYIGDCASNGRQALELYRKNSYQVIVLDVTMPGGDGISACKALRQLGCTTPIIFLTARDTLDDKIAGFEAGADDYLVKPFHMRELLHRIAALSTRISKHGSASLSCGPLVMNLNQHNVIRDGQTLALSQLQFKLLHCLLTHSPNVISRQSLIAQVWGDDLPDSDALRSHLYQLRGIIDKPFAYPLLHTIRGKGFQLVNQTACEK